MIDKQSKLDARGIIGHFGGCATLWKLLKTRGVHLSHKAVQAWAARNSIPSARLVELVDLGLSTSNPLRVNDFIVKGS